MKHCSNCNQDFEGNVCPNCGAEGEEIKPAAAENTPATPKAKNSGLIIGIIAGIAVIAVAAVLIILLSGNKNNSSGSQNGGNTSVAQHTHSFGSWSTVKNATCTEAGSQERYCSCGEKQVQIISASGHSFGEWTIVNNASCTENGTKERACSCGKIETATIKAAGHKDSWVVDTPATCKDPGEGHYYCSVCKRTSVQSIPKTTEHSYNEGTATKTPTCVLAGEKTQECAVCGNTNIVAIPALNHTMDSTGKCTRCGLVTLNMTDKEKGKAKTVNTISYSVYTYSFEIDIYISFKDSKTYSVEVPAYVDVKIVNDDGETVYKKTLVKKTSDSKVIIDIDDIEAGYTQNGTLYYKVYNDTYFSFDEMQYSLTNLPWKVDVELPTLPTTIYYYAYSSTTACRVTSITYTISGSTLKISFAGEKTYDSRGTNQSANCRIGWKLYDSDGYVVDSGTLYTSSIKTGEKFRDQTISIYDITPGESYQLVISNVN